MNQLNCIQLTKVCKSFKEADTIHHVLQDLNLSVASGEKVAILGRSGSGKTTLLNILSALMTPDTGRYEAIGEDIGQLTEKQKTSFRRHNIGYVFQYYNLIPSLTAQENIEFVLKLTGKMSRFSQAMDMCKQLEVAQCLHKLPAQLSGGQQQRIAIVRALASQPKILLADEPTGNLDEETGNMVAKCLYESVDMAGVALVLVTHSNDLARGSDKQYYLHHGTLIETPS